MKKLLMSTLMMSLLVLTSCGSSSSASSSAGNGKNQTSRQNLMDVKWVMTDETGTVSVGEEDNKKELYINFPTTPPDSYNAFLGCNTISGKVSAGEKGQIRFLDVASTRKACPDMSYEQTFNKMVTSVNHYEINAGKLNFYRDSLLLMSFKKGKTK